MNQQNLADFIWSVADVLRGDYKQPHRPAVHRARRLECVLEPTRDKPFIPHIYLDGMAPPHSTVGAVEKGATC